MSSQDFNEIPTSELLQEALAHARSTSVLESDDYWVRIRALHFRAGRGVFEEAAELCSSADPILRGVGADILAQLGVREGVVGYPFADESVPIVVSLLGDTEPHVTMSALYPLGHLGKGEPLQLARLANHPSEDIRCALAYALGGRTDDVSVDTEIRLSEDQDVDSWNWATFATGALLELDSPVIRDALAARMSMLKLLPLSMASPNRLSCFGARYKGICDNGLTIRRDEVESRVLKALQEKLLNQELFEEFCDEFTREMNRLRMEHRADLSAAEREIERIEVRRKKLVESIMDGVPACEVKDELNANAVRREALKAKLAAADEPPPLLHPEMARIYGTKVAELAQALQQPENRAEATVALRGLVDAIVLTRDGRTAPACRTVAKSSRQSSARSGDSSRPSRMASRRCQSKTSCCRSKPGKPNCNHDSIRRRCRSCCIHAWPTSIARRSAASAWRWRAKRAARARERPSER
jgi:hypothetical protein